MEYTQYVKPELLILVPVLWLVGAAIKATPKIQNWLIPYILGIISIFLSALYVFSMECICMLSVFTAVTQGILVVGASVYGNQLIKQAIKMQ